MQPARDAGSRTSRRPTPACRRRPNRVGGVSRASTTGPIGRRGRPSTTGCREQGAPAAAGPRVHPRLATPQPVRLPGGRRLHRPSPARRDVAPPRLVGPGDRRAVRAAGGAGRPTGRLGAGLPVARVARPRRRRADAAARRGARATRRIATSCRRARSTPTTSSRRTCGAPSSCPRRRSCRSSTS